MRNRKINWLNVIVGIIIILYVIFSSDFKNDVKKASASVTNTIKTTTKAEVKKVDGNLKVSFIDVGQADSILIENNNHNMLIDAGNNADGKKLVNYFKENNIESFDYVVATHPHEDHIGGIDDIINNFDVSTFYMPEVLTTTKTFEDVLDALDNKNMKYDVPKIDDTFNLGDANIKVIYVGNSSSDLNDSSIVLKLTYGNNSFLFTGDATSNVEKQILNKELKSDVLKVGHHGSSYSSTNEFLDKVSPKYAVISCGLNNIYHHPTSSTLNKLSNKKIKLYRTDEVGTIIMTSDGNDITVDTKKTDTNG